MIFVDASALISIITGEGDEICGPHGRRGGAPDFAMQ